MTGKDYRILLYIDEYCDEIKETILRFGADLNVFCKEVILYYEKNEK
jgi:hypothetical protein